MMIEKSSRSFQRLSRRHLAYTSNHVLQLGPNAAFLQSSEATNSSSFHTFSRHFSASRTSSLAARPKSRSNPLDYVNQRRYQEFRQQVFNKWLYRYAGGVAVIVTLQAIYLYTTGGGPWERSTPPVSASKLSSERLDANPAQSEAYTNTSSGSPLLVVPKPGAPAAILNEDGIEVVPTGTSTIPHFPRTVKLALPTTVPSSPDVVAPPAAVSAEEEYQLMGLGVRRVSWFNIEVYVLGLYLRTSDLPKLQEAFVKHVNPLGSSLIPDEKEKLRTLLLDAEGSMDVWEKVLKDTKTRSCVRIVPVKNTDFAHLRDGWVTGITARTQRGGDAAKVYQDESFGRAMASFKALWGGKGKAPTGSVVYLTRDESGKLGVLYEAKGGAAAAAKRESMGTIEDERISRQVWLGYLAGKSVSSEDARKSIVDGVMELVERPVGTVGVGIA